MRVIAENLGYRELARLGEFLINVTQQSKYYDEINLWSTVGYEYIELGYDLKYDECYMCTDLGVYLYESDFE